ncbi:MAG: Arc family DNA-binding protein [Desulfobacteraceae bacterium]|nr:MAG: Arc family DNA-binding protein [Desulfobacteraceae bacterium]
MKNPPLNIRMPAGMKKALEEIAAKEFRSLNSVILQFLDEQLRLKGINWQEQPEKKTKK